MGAFLNNDPWAALGQQAGISLPPRHTHSAVPFPDLWPALHHLGCFTDASGTNCDGKEKIGPITPPTEKFEDRLASCLDLPTASNVGTRILFAIHQLDFHLCGCPSQTGSSSGGLGGCCSPSILAGATPEHDDFSPNGSQESSGFALSPSAKFRASPVEGGMEGGTQFG